MADIRPAHEAGDLVLQGRLHKGAVQVRALFFQPLQQVVHLRNARLLTQALENMRRHLPPWAGLCRSRCRNRYLMLATIDPVATEHREQLLCLWPQRLQHRQDISTVPEAKEHRRPFRQQYLGQAAQMLDDGVQGTGRHRQPTPVDTFTFSGPFQKSAVDGDHRDVGHDLLPRCILAARPDGAKCTSVGTPPRIERLAVAGIAHHHKQLLARLQRRSLKPLPGRNHGAPAGSDVLRCRGVLHTPFLQRSHSSQKGALRFRLNTWTALNGA
eukprot:gene18944-29179_t